MKIALVGNQNSGKTSLFNVLSGENQKIGNWAGVTIERKEGVLRSTNDTIVDLPGIYSLSPYTSEEEVTRRFIMEEHPDLLINILDATSLERSLYLTTQLRDLNIDMILALNMSDIMAQKGIVIDVAKLQDLLGVSIVTISAKRNEGIDELINVVKNKSYKKHALKRIFPNDVEDLIDKVTEHVDSKDEMFSRFIAIKMIENDYRYSVLTNEHTKQEINDIEKQYEMDGEQLIASLRYDYIEKLKDDCVKNTKVKQSISDRIDKVVLNRFAAIPLFIAIMALIYFISIGLVGGLLTPLINALFVGEENITLSIGLFDIDTSISFIGLGPLLKETILNIGGSEWAASLVNDGIFVGVGTVLSFLPQLIALFLLMALLESSGYMARIAFFLDRIFHNFGLSGKSLIPFILGSGCSVAGVMSTRIIEDDKERNSTIILTPFVPCSAKLPLITMFAAYFFNGFGFLIALSMYVLAIAFILLFGLIFKKIIFKGDHSSFLSELPSFQAPNARYVARDVFDRSFEFVKRAGTIVLLASVVVWFLSSFTWGFEYIATSTVFNSNDSMLAYIGRLLSWAFMPMLGGINSWEATVAAIQGLLAREQVVSSLSVTMMSTGKSILEIFTPLTAFAYLVFVMFSAPCVATLASMSKELKNKKYMILTVVFEFLFAYILASLIGGVGWLISL